MALLPLFKIEDVQLTLWQTKWKSLLDPILGNELVNGIQLRNILLATGDNVINHRLGRTMQGWILTDQSANSLIYRSQPLNSATLTLNSSGPVTVSLWCF